MQTRSMWACAAAAALAGLGLAFITLPVSAVEVVMRPSASSPLATAVFDLPSALRQTSKVVEGVVTKIENQYSDAEGPWTVVTFRTEATYMGNGPGAEFVIRQFGGTTPQKRQVVVTGQTHFIQGERYVLFLRNTAWNYSPIVSDLVYRVATVDRKEVLTTSDGRLVTSVAEHGVDLGEQVLDAQDLTGDGYI